MCGMRRKNKGGEKGKEKVPQKKKTPCLPFSITKKRCNTFAFVIQGNSLAAFPTFFAEFNPSFLAHFFFFPFSFFSLCGAKGRKIAFPHGFFDFLCQGKSLEKKKS
jgi:hypothetical protein